VPGSTLAAVGGSGASLSDSTTIRVVVADDVLLVREGVQRLLEATDDIEIVGVADTLESLLLAVEEHDPDVVVTDIRMPPTHTDEGIRAAAALRRESPRTGVVVLSQYAEPAYALDLFSNGTAGRAYLLKDRLSDTGQVADAVREVAAGGSVTDPAIVDLLVTSTHGAADPLADLTPRERDVLACIAQGKNNAGIATALGVSQKAVENVINSLFPKLGLLPEPTVHRRVLAVLLFLDAQGDRH
jgi:DNA-binding NarL/FixJ family response regulator